jgi:two-component system, chemotaxis family, protein-glutamate methylesterase/glutaminase
LADPRSNAGVRAELIPKIKALCGVVLPLKLPAAAARARPAEGSASNPRIEIVAIGTSTGGPNALAEVLPRIPNDFPVPIVVVQHMPPIFTRLLAERLASRSRFPWKRAVRARFCHAGHAWIAPGNFHMKVCARALRVAPEPESGAAGELLPSRGRCAVSLGGRGLRCKCSGSRNDRHGSDGVLGAQDIRDAGGNVIIQDEASSVVWGMPGLVHASGLDDAAYPLDQLAAEITRRVLQSRASRTFPST